MIRSLQKAFIIIFIKNIINYKFIDRYLIVRINVSRIFVL